jgi:hypothetical protein
MRKLHLSMIVNRIANSAVSVDETSLDAFDDAMKKLTLWRVQVEKMRAAVGGQLPADGLLVIGSTAYDSLDSSNKVVVHDINEFRLRRKG